MTVSEAAEKLGVTGARIRQLVADGRLKAERFGLRSLNVNVTSVNALAVKREKKRKKIEDSKGDK